MRIPDKESNDLRELEEQLQGAYKQIDEIQNRIDEIFIDAKDTSNEATDIDTRQQHIPGESA
jgi:peptidoglycan hydrolase CwlO-like protein